MKRDLFVQQLSSADVVVDEKYLTDTLLRSIEASYDDGSPRGQRNLIIANEELTELSQCISKELRGKGDYYNLLQEMADVMIGIRYLQELCNVSDDDLHRAINVKLDRVNHTLDTDGVYY